MIIKQKNIIIFIEEDTENYNAQDSKPKKEIWYFPKIIAKTKDVIKLNIKNIDNLVEVKKKVFECYKDKYISNVNLSEPIINKDTKMKIEIWKSGIN